MLKVFSGAAGVLLVTGPLWGAIAFTEIPLPSPRTINPQALAVAADGKIWFTDFSFRQIGYVDPQGQITRFPLTDTVDPTNEVRPLAITNGPDGNMWFTLYITNGSGSPLDRSAVGRITPTGQVSLFPMPTGNSCRDFFGGPACGITTGPDGNLWYVATQTQRFGRVTPAGAITEFVVPTGGSFMLDITAGPDGNLWSAARVSRNIVRITPAGQITTFPLTGTTPAPWDLTEGSDGNIWFTNSGSNTIGRITPAGAITEFPLPTPQSFPFHITSAADGFIYFTEASATVKRVVRFDPRVQVAFEETDVAGPVPADIEAGPLRAGKIAPDADGNDVVFNAQNTEQPRDYRLFQIIVPGGGPPPCAISCPPNVTISAGEGQLSAVATFATPTLQNCPAGTTVNLSHQSGSSFLAGTTTTVTATTTPPGPSCTFTVTVTAFVPLAFDTAANQLFGGDDGDPVSTSTGELYSAFPPDLSLGGPLPLSLSRYYATLLVRDNNFTSALGTNWSHNFDWSVKQITADGSRVGIVNPRGRIHQFQRNGNTFVLQAPLDLPVQLTATASGLVFGDPISERIYTFNNAGRLVRIDDSHGNSFTLVYNGNNLSSVADGLGRTLTFGYDPANHLTSVTDGTRTVRYTYAGNNLATYVDALSKTTTYAYDQAGRMTSTTMPRGNVRYAQGYDSAGRVASQTSGGANSSTFTYTADRTTLTDPGSFTRMHTHNPAPPGQLTALADENARSIQMGYDSAGRRTSVTDRMGDTSRLAYHSASGKIAEIVNAEGGRTVFTYGNRAFNSVTLFPLTAITHADNSTESFGYDPNGNMISRMDRGGRQWSYTWNTRGQLLTATNPTGGVLTFTYNPDSTIATSRDSDTGITTFGYDALRRLNRLTYPDSSSAQVEYDANDRIVAIIDELGRRYSYGYDANDNLTQVTDPATKSRQFAYDALDRMNQVTNRVGGVTRVTFNNRDLPATVVDPNNNQLGLVFDARRRLTSVTDPATRAWSLSYDDEGISTSSSNPLNQTWSSATNRLGQMTFIRNPLGQQWTFARDAMQRITAFTDPLSRSTTATYDTRGLISTIARPGLGSAQYQRNDLGVISSIRDLNGQTWQRGYSPMGRLQSVRDPLARTTSYSYDPRGRLSVVGFPDAGVSNHSFDSAGNLIRANYSGGPDLQYTYDSLNRVISASGTTIGYDDEGRPVSTAAGAVASGATYDAGGRLTSVTYNNGAFAVNYTYDSRDLVTAVRDTLTNTQINFTYDEAHRMTGISRPNGVNSQFTYDPAGRLIRIREGTIIDLTYALNGAGEVVNVQGTAPADAGSAALETLQSAFTYDAASQPAGSGFSNDQRGRATSGGGHTFGWDGASRLTSIDGTTLEYDGLDQLLRRGSTTYSYNLAFGPGTIVGDGTRFYVRLPGGALLYAIEGASAIHYHFDRTGSTIALTNPGGSVTDSFAYDPYGMVLVRTGSNSQPFTFIGRYGVRSEPTGNIYQIRARYYSSQAARFLSKDPIDSMDPQSLNPYQYGFGDPIGFVDISGLDAIDVESVRVNTNLTQKTFDSIPVQGRNFSDILTLQPTVGSGTKVVPGPGSSTSPSPSRNYYPVEFRPGYRRLVHSDRAPSSPPEKTHDRFLRRMNTWDRGPAVAPVTSPSGAHFFRPSSTENRSIGRVDYRDTEYGGARPAVGAYSPASTENAGFDASTTMPAFDGLQRLPYPLLPDADVLASTGSLREKPDQLMKVDIRKALGDGPPGYDLSGVVDQYEPYDDRFRTPTDLQLPRRFYLGARFTF